MSMEYGLDVALSMQTGFRGLTFTLQEKVSYFLEIGGGEGWTKGAGPASMKAAININIHKISCGFACQTNYPAACLASRRWSRVRLARLADIAFFIGLELAPKMHSFISNEVQLLSL